MRVRETRQQIPGFLVGGLDPQSSLQRRLRLRRNPGRADGETNLIAVEEATTMVAQNATREMVVVGKSTVPVQTAERSPIKIDSVLR